MFWKPAKKLEEQEPLEYELSVSNYPDEVTIEEPTVNEMLQDVLRRLDSIEKKINEISRDQ